MNIIMERKEKIDKLISGELSQIDIELTPEEIEYIYEKIKNH